MKSLEVRFASITVMMLLLNYAVTFSQEAIVMTSFGAVKGNLFSNGYEFLGIPFASPPVGEARWKPPINPETWNSPLLTQSFKPACPQKLYEQGDTTYTLLGDEDCLYLNIWTPDTVIADHAVMVFIHGGGNQQGSAGQLSMGTLLYDGKNLAARGNVVVVTLQYRLGALGYLVHPGLETENAENTSGNYGVMDQILALQWIKSNISAFGGDTSKIMIFGESAGGVNTGNLLTTPMAAGLFQRACIQSAIPSLGNYDDARNVGIDFVDQFTNQGNDSVKIAFMRSLSADSISIRMENPVPGGIVQPKWKPVVDDQIFFDDPETIFQSSDFNHVPLMIGSNADEMSASAPLIVYPLMVTALINSIFPPGLQAQALALYPPGNNTAEARESYVQLLTDSQFTATTRRTARCVSLNQSANVYRYLFSHQQSGPLEIYGSYHGLELFYVFNNYENTNYAVGPWFTDQDDSIQKIMLSYWVQFATTGDPNNAQAEIWPVYQSSEDCYLEIKANPDGSQCGLRTGKSDLWDEVIGYENCSSSLGLLKEDPKEFLLFPNPANHTIFIQLPEDITPEYVSIRDINGRILKEYRNCKSMEVVSLKPGMYFITVQAGEYLITSKFIKN